MPLSFCSITDYIYFSSTNNVLALSTLPGRISARSKGPNRVSYCMWADPWNCVESDWLEWGSMWAHTDHSAGSGPKKTSNIQSKVWFCLKLIYISCIWQPLNIMNWPVSCSCCRSSGVGEAIWRSGLMEQFREEGPYLGAGWKKMWRWLWVKWTVKPGIIGGAEFGNW